MSEEAVPYMVDAPPTVVSPMNLLLIQELVGRLPGAADDEAKGIRAGLRGLGFRIENFKPGGPRFSLVDLQAALDSGKLRVSVS